MAGDDDTPEELEGEGVDLPKKKVSGKKIVLFILLALILLGSGGAGLYFTGVIGSGNAEKSENKSEHPDQVEDAGPPIFYEMPQILINLQSPGRRPSFLRLEVSLQLVQEEDKEIVEAALPRVIDSFQFYLRELSREELEGSAGFERLREELHLRVSAAVAPVEVKAVLFTGLVFGS